MNPFRQWHGNHPRVVCQIVHIRPDPDGMLVDLVTLEPSTWRGERVSAGTPFTIEFTAAPSDAREELCATMRRWEQACSALDIGVDQGPHGLRYEFAAGRQVLVVTVDEAPGGGL